jgi:hypothetical protein
VLHKIDHLPFLVGGVAKIARPGHLLRIEQPPHPGLRAEAMQIGSRRFGQQ